MTINFYLYDKNHADEIIARIEAVLPILNEQQQRVYLAAEAKSYGWGGKTKIAEFSSVSRKTIAKVDGYLQEEENISKQNRIRKKGADEKNLLIMIPNYYKR